jgi:capsid protein
MRGQLMAAAVAAGVPYEVLTGDMREVNDRTVRVILYEFRRRVEQWQHHVVAFQFCRPVWDMWFRQAIIGGALELPNAAAYEDLEPWMRVEWIAPTWPYLHPTQDVEAEKAMVRSGFKSRTQVAKERGYDVEQLDREIAADNARADRLGLVFDTDPRKVQPSGAPPPAPPSEDPPPPPPVERPVNVTIAEGAVRVENAITVPSPRPRKTVVEKTITGRDEHGRASGVRETHTET